MIGINSYRQELSEVLQYMCFACSIRGPLLGNKSHDMINIGTVDQDIWACTNFHKNQLLAGPDSLQSIINGVITLGQPTLNLNNTLKLISLPITNRQVFVPAVFAHNIPALNETTENLLHTQLQYLFQSMLMHWIL